MSGGWETATDRQIQLQRRLCRQSDSDRAPKRIAGKNRYMCQAIDVVGFWSLSITVSIIVHRFQPYQVCMPDQVCWVHLTWFNLIDFNRLIVRLLTVDNRLTLWTVDTCPSYVDTIHVNCCSQKTLGKLVPTIDSDRLVDCCLLPQLCASVV